MPEISQKKILMVIAFRDFRDEEYFVPKKVFEEAGAEVFTASSALGEAVGKYGGQTEVDIPAGKAAAENYDAVVFVGGPGAYKHFDDQTWHLLAKSALEQGKVLAAICVAPAILAKAGLLKDKKATVWSSAIDKSAIKILSEAGAHFLKQGVVVDGKIVTADGPEQAENFAKAVIQLL